MILQEKARSSMRLATVLIVLVTIPSVLLARVSPSLNETVLIALATLILVVSLYAFSGNSGVFSFGHLAMAMVGGYVTAITAMPSEAKDLLYPTMLSGLRAVYLGQVGAILAGGLAALVVGSVLALTLARMSGLTAGLATFVVLLIAFSLATGMEPVTNGSSGLVKIPEVDRVWQVLPWTALTILLVAGFQSSRSCQRLRAAREDENAAASVGVRIHRERAIAFMFSSLIAGIGGGVYVLIIGSMSPPLFYLGLTTTVVAMLVIGGMTSLTGAVLGTVVIATLNETTNRMENGVVIFANIVKLPTGTQQVSLALAMLVILMARPAGLMGGRELRVRLRGRTRSIAKPRVRVGVEA